MIKITFKICYFISRSAKRRNTCAASHRIESNLLHKLDNFELFISPLEALDEPFQCSRRSLTNLKIMTIWQMQAAALFKGSPFSYH